MPASYVNPQQESPGNRRRGRSLFSTLFYVAAIRGKAPRNVSCLYALSYPRPHGRQGAHKAPQRAQRPLELRRLRGITHPQMPRAPGPERRPREHRHVLLGEEPLRERLAGEPRALEYAADVGEAVERARGSGTADALDRVQAARQLVALQLEPRYHAGDRLLRTG